MNRSCRGSRANSLTRCSLFSVPPPKSALNPSNSASVQRASLSRYSSGVITPSRVPRTSPACPQSRRPVPPARRQERARPWRRSSTLGRRQHQINVVGQFTQPKCGRLLRPVAASWDRRYFHCVARNQRGSEHRSRLDFMRFHFYLPPFTQVAVSHRHPSLHHPAPEPVRVEQRLLLG
jgi:hypothetical protein